MARKILLNYRRADSKGYAVAIYNSLVSSFGEDQIFMDIDAIEPGTDFVKVLEKAVKQCDVLIVIIGSQWLGIKDASGERRLEDEGDFVRIEIKAALEREVTVLPVLVQGAIMPSAAKLPDDIRSLARRQAFVISDRFSADVEQLVEVLNRILERARRERLKKDKAEKKRKKTTKPLIRIPSFARKRPEKVPKSTSEKADLKAEIVKKAEKKKPSKLPKPAPLVRKQPEKVLEKPSVKAEAKPKAVEKARKRAPVKPIPKTTRRIFYALSAVAILVISYILVKNMDIFTKDSKPAENVEIPLPEFTKEPTPIEIPVEIPAPLPTATPLLGFGPTLISEIDGMTLVYVPEGPFTMGSEESDPDAYNDEFPQHRVELDAFWIDQTEVTNAMFAEFLNEMGNQKEGGANWMDNADEDARISQSGGIWAADLGYANHPVVEITWYGALAYCQWAERELPTEAQWEKAARGTDGRTYPWGNTFDSSLLNLDDETIIDNYTINCTSNGCDGYDRTAPVGSFPGGASPYGALDMAGNVWEWVRDWYGVDYYNQSPDSNPEYLIDSGLKVLRGGSWTNSAGVRHARSAFRTIINPRATFGCGFRCVMDAE
jgi:formylglycine-generating enzyme required for sulfatase activity